jgi:obg-like ATPase 1
MVHHCPLPFILILSFFNRLFNRLPKIKGWIDEHNPGDPLIPFSVALEERLAPLPAEEKAAEQKSVGAQSALGKIMQAGYASLEVG